MMAMLMMRGEECVGRSVCVWCSSVVSHDGSVLSFVAACGGCDCSGCGGAGGRGCDGSYRSVVLILVLVVMPSLWLVIVVV